MRLKKKLARFLHSVKLVHFAALAAHLPAGAVFSPLHAPVDVVCIAYSTLRHRVDARAIRRRRAWVAGGRVEQTPQNNKTCETSDLSSRFCVCVCVMSRFDTKLTLPDWVRTQQQSLQNIAPPAPPPHEDATEPPSAAAVASDTVASTSAWYVLRT